MMVCRPVLRSIGAGSTGVSRAGCQRWPVSRACRERADASVSEAIWSTITRFRRAVVGGRVEQRPELRVQALRRAGGERLGELGEHDALVGAEPLLLRALHDVTVGDRLEYRALQPGPVRNDQFGRVPGEPAGAVRPAGRALGGQTEPADELTGGVLQPGLGDGRSVVAVRPPLLGERAVEGGGQFGRVGVVGHVASEWRRPKISSPFGPRRAGSWGRCVRRAARPRRRARSTPRRRPSP